MSSSDDNYASHRRRNPRRTCRPIVEEPDKSHTPATGDKVSVLHRNNSKMMEDLHPARSRGLRKTRNDKQKPQAVSLSACPKSLPKSTRQGRCLNGQVSANSHTPEPIKRPKPKYPAKTTKRSRKGRTKSDVEPCEKADVPTSNDGDCFKRLEDSEPAASAGSQNAAKSYRTRLRPSNKSLNLVSPGLFTRTALSPQKQKISRHTKNAGSSSPHTPKRINVRPGPLLSSTPNSNLESLNRADSSCSPCHRAVTRSSPLSSPDVKPLRKCRTQRLLAAERPAGRKKRTVQERPGSSRPPKHSRKSESFLTESPQMEPSVETPPASRTEEQDPSLSSDLSIELSLQEELQPFYHSLSLQEEEDQDNEEEELPSFLRQDNKKSSSISEGLCVWCKLRKYPYWPAVVKSVNRKTKKASIVFIDGYIIDQKRSKKGFSVSLRTLKSFNCEDFDKLVDIAKAKYGSALTWSLELISDYKIRIGCGSFVGSLIEYCAADISCPVRRKFTEGTSVLTFPSQEILSEQNHDFDNSEDIILPEHDDVSKKVLPDRAKAARNRANVHLVDFIVNGRKVENRLLAVINGDEPSRWMRALRNPTRQWVDVYLEDEEQVDKVYSYLNEVCDSSPHINTCLEKIQADRITLILDVLLPEAIIHAIAGVHQLSLEKAEEKYRSGPCFSNRERQEFDMMIEQQMKLKEIRLCKKQKD